MGTTLKNSIRTLWKESHWKPMGEEREMREKMRKKYGKGRERGRRVSGFIFAFFFLHRITLEQKYDVCDLISKRFRKPVF